MLNLTESHIKYRMWLTKRTGFHPLWEGYQQPNAVRHPADVSTGIDTGRTFMQLVRDRKPEVIVEFGSAFGASGMYWLAALQREPKGHLYTFEVNPEWAQLARKNLAAIGKRFTSVIGTFEDNVGQHLNGDKIDICFIDGIHRSDWVLPQFEIVLAHMRPKGMVIFDDINFSDDMKDCWERIKQHPRVSKHWTNPKVTMGFTEIT